MSQPVLLKVYASLWPCGQELCAELARISEQAIPAAECVGMDADLLTIAFEGIYYPVDEVLAAIRAGLQPEQQGRLDALDLEAFRLARYHIGNGAITESSARLNDVLAISDVEPGA